MDTKLSSSSDAGPDAGPPAGAAPCPGSSAVRRLARRPAHRMSHYMTRHMIWRLPLRPLLLFLAGAFVWACGSLGGFPGAAHACDVIVVKSDALSLYEKAISGMETTLPCRMTTLSFATQKEEEVLGAVASRNPDAVVAVGTYAFRKLRGVQIPNLIYTMALPYEADPGGADNIAGVGILISPEAYIGSIVEVFGSVRSIGVLYGPGSASGYAHEISAAARARGIDVVPIEVHAVEDASSAFRELRSRPEVLLMLPDPAVASPEALNAILLYSFRNSVPLVSFARKYAALGAVLSLEVDPYDIGVQTGDLAGKIVKGGKHSSRKVYARKVRLTINRKVVEKMSLALRESALERAEVIR